MTPKLNVISIVVADMAKSLAFYRLLGLDVAAEQDDAPHAEHVLPNGLKLCWDTIETIRSFDPQWSAPEGGSRCMFAFECDTPAEVDKLHDELVAAGHPSHIGPWDAFWGQRYAVVHDPDGNGVDFYCPIG